MGPSSTEPYRRGNNALFLIPYFLILKPLKEIQDPELVGVQSNAVYDELGLYNEKLFDNLANKAKEAVKTTKNQHRLITRRLKHF